MIISDLIKYLEVLLEKHWDLQITVQYRDSWWNYHGQDEDCMPIVKDWKIIM